METAFYRRYRELCPVFPAYLQGMETVPRRPGDGPCLCRSQPTYKEWKPLRTPFGSVPGLWAFPAYLQGMETIEQVIRRFPDPLGSQPTYKEWKPVPGKGKGHHQVVFPAYLQGMEIEIPEEAKTFVKLVPSLPTRNGNNTSEKVFCFAPVRSQPTYKEWKVAHITVFPLAPVSSPAYLQGMETEGDRSGDVRLGFVPTYL